MKIDIMNVLGSVVVVGALAVAGCSKQPAVEPTNTTGVAERVGAALDKAVEKTVEVATNGAEKTTEAAKATAAATKDVAGQALEKTGQALKKAGAAAEQAGAGLQQ